LGDSEINVGILSWIVVGLIAGFLASLIVRGSGFGIVWDILVGVLGAMLGGWISAKFLHIGSVTGINLVSILIATLGAVVLLVIFRLLRRL
jgi:uncharacterized membrane protein YeaQ/YmgE (transglycosylase-associated protein family)